MKPTVWPYFLSLLMVPALPVIWEVSKKTRKTAKRWIQNTVLAGENLCRSVVRLRPRLP